MNAEGGEGKGEWKYASETLQIIVVVVVVVISPCHRSQESQIRRRDKSKDTLVIVA